MYSKRAVTLALTLVLLSSCAFIGLSSILVDNWDVNSSVPDLVNGDNVDIKSRFAGGKGTENDPYQISNVSQLQDMSLDVRGNYTLINDIDASPTNDWNNGTGFEPIGNITGYNYDYNPNAFNGTFNGNGFIIRNLFINRSSAGGIGLFGYIRNNGFIRNVGLIDVKVSGDFYVGGLAGQNFGVVVNCYATGNVSCDNIVGGLIGENIGGTISNCYTTGNVSGHYNTGGFVGLNRGTVMDCFTIGNVIGDENSGGFIGTNQGTVKNCYVIGNFTGRYRVGGLIGINEGEIENCYVTGNVRGTGEYIGGLVGWNGIILFREKNVTITNCYAAGNVIAEEDYHPVLVSEYSFGDSKPLKPNYIWQMERGKFYQAENVPTEWQEGNATAKITDIEFAD